jgi:hypothetical protein
LNEAKQNYTSALESLTFEDQPQEWAALQFGLAHLNHLQYQKDGGIVAADRAADGYQNVLGHITQQTLPYVWALTHYYLAKLVSNASSTDEEQFRSIDATNHFEQCLTVFTADRFPYQFVDAKIKLGDLLIAQTEGEKSENIELAIHAYESILNELPKVVNLIPESSLFIRLGDAFTQRIKGDRTNNNFQALAYYKQSLASLGEIRDQAEIEKLRRKIAQLQ